MKLQEAEIIDGLIIINNVEEKEHF